MGSHTALQLLQIYKPTRSVYGTACWMPYLVGCRMYVLWLRDVVSLAVLMTEFDPSLDEQKYEDTE
jgi:hypothetical protein